MDRGMIMQIGFIGTGSMGRILIEAFLQAKFLLPQQIHASNRTFSKVKDLAQQYTGLHAYPTNIRVAQRADVIFLCIKPLEFKYVLDEIAPFVTSEQLVISITSPVEIQELENILPSKVAKIIPSITNVSGSGGSLLIAGERCTEEDRLWLQELMGSISKPIWIEEKYTRVSSDIVSCGPAFFSFILQKWIDAAVHKTGISQQDATALASTMIIGLGQLMQQEKYTLETLQEKVCVPGGVTGVGLKVLEQELKDTFDLLVEQTHHKFEEDRELVKEMFYAEGAKTAESKKQESTRGTGKSALKAENQL